jgi:hypothetical protein
MTVLPAPVVVMHDLADGERDRGGRHVDDHIDLVDVDPVRTILEPASGLF